MLNFSKVKHYCFLILGPQKGRKAGFWAGVDLHIGNILCIFVIHKDDDIKDDDLKPLRSYVHEECIYCVVRDYVVNYLFFHCLVSVRT